MYEAVFAHTLFIDTEGDGKKDPKLIFSWIQSLDGIHNFYIFVVACFK